MQVVIIWAADEANDAPGTIEEQRANALRDQHAAMLIEPSDVLQLCRGETKDLKRAIEQLQKGKKLLHNLEKACGKCDSGWLLDGCRKRELVFRKVLRPCGACFTGSAVQSIGHAACIS